MQRRARPGDDGSRGTGAAPTFAARAVLDVGRPEEPLALEPIVFLPCSGDVPAARTGSTTAVSAARPPRAGSRLRALLRSPVWRSATHPLHGLGAALLVAASFTADSATPALVGLPLLEVLALALLPRWAPFRRRVLRAVADDERESGLRRRTALRPCMTPEHAAGLDLLERLVGETRDMLSRWLGDRAFALDALLRLEGLVDAWADAAVALQRGEALLVGPGKVDEPGHDDVVGGGTLAGRRREMIAARRRCRARNLRRLEALRQEMATIQDAVLLVRERVVGITELRAAGEELEVALAALDDATAALDEVFGDGPHDGVDLGDGVDGARSA